MIAGGIDEGVVVGNEIIRGVTVFGPARWQFGFGLWLAADGMAACGILIDVDSQDTGKYFAANGLGVVVHVVSGAFVADAQVEKSVRPERHAAAFVPEVVVELVD